MSEIIEESCYAAGDSCKVGKLDLKPETETEIAPGDKKPEIMEKSEDGDILQQKLQVNHQN